MSMRILAILAGLSLCSLNAQVAGTISGFVRDQTGAVIASAHVQAVLTGQQLTRSALTDTTGFFNLLAMQPGAYEITVTAPGFQKLVQSDVRLTSGENLRVDAELRVGSVQNEVTVSSQGWAFDPNNCLHSAGMTSLGACCELTKPLSTASRLM